MIGAALHALAALGDPMRLLVLLAGVIIGLVLGVIPGLGGVVGLTLLIPFTYGLDTYSAFALLLGMAAVTTISDLIPAILFGMPGSVGAAATVMDGHAMAKRGEAGRALGAGYASALIGGIMGAILLALVIPVIRPAILYIGSPELLSFSIFGLSMVAVLSGRAPLKGFTGAGLGIMLAMIGSGSQTGTERWTFDSLYLWDHLPLIPFTLGLFAMPELAEMAVMRSSIARVVDIPDFTVRAQWQGARDALKHWWLIVRCGWLGAVLGTIPGLGASSIDWIAYGHAMRTEKNAGGFGHGDVRGVIAPEASNNAKEGGHLIPTIAFGVPSGASMAVLLSAFLLHGLVPGPDMLTKHLDVTFLMIWSLTLAHIVGGLICLAASGWFARLSTVRPGKLVPIVLALMFLSAFQGSQSWGDLWTLALFGLIGWIMKALNWPRPPLMLGFVLGTVFERNLFISTEIYGGGWAVRPVVIGVLAVTIWVVFRPLRDNVRDVAAAFRHGRGPKLHFGPSALFNVAILAVVGAALWQSLDWPWEAKLVPHAAAYLVLVFAGLNLLTEVVFRPTAAPAAEPARTGMPVHADLLSGAAIARAGRYFVWLLAFLATGLGIGMLPGLFLLVLFQSRLEFRERWSHSFLVAGAVACLSWLLFDRVFHLVWPQSMLGDAVPSLRATLGIV